MKKSFSSEREFTQWLTARAGATSGRVRLGIGDDAALIAASPGMEWVLTSDMSIEGIHFRRDKHSPRSIGHRALARSLSDLAAMGARPRYALLSVVLSSNIDRSWIEEFYRGFTTLAKRFSVDLIGGDTSLSARTLMMDVAAVGEATRGRALRRSGARPGDGIYLAGTLGLSALGLRGLLGRRNTAPPAALRAHLFPTPQCRLGEFLARERIASAAIDVSDGLSLDLTRLLEASHAGGQVRESDIPLPRGAKSSDEALDLALNGGEDYRLLFTVPPRKERRLPASFEAIRLHKLGTVRSPEDGILLEGAHGARPLVPEGYDHFRRANLR